MTHGRVLLPIFASLFLASCSPDSSPEDAHDHGDHEHPATPADADADADEPWAVTAWGEKFEIFAECDPLTVGEVSPSHTHVTVLDGFPPLRSGTVTAVLRRGTEVQEFRQTEPARDGIYNVEIRSASEGEFELAFRVETESASEEIPSGRVRVGHAGDPGGLIEAPATPTAAGDVPFLKEQQWRTEFATAWVGAGSVRESVRGPGRVRAAAGGDAILSAPLDGVVRTDTRVHVGEAVRRGSAVLSLAPRAGSDRSLPELEAELDLARRRLERLEELVRAEAVSVAEVEAARAQAASLTTRVAAAKGETDAAAVAVIRAPFDGRVAQVFVAPGGSVAAGEPLVRVVRTDPLWIEVDLRPADAALLRDEAVGLLVRAGASAEAMSFEPGRVRTVARSPMVDPRTGKIAAIFEVSDPTESLPLGLVADVEVLLGREVAGVVVPASALVDDGGVPVVYVQADGESFARREVTVITRQGEHVLVEGLQPGERLVTRGGAAIRRASLTSSTLEGHVH